MRKFYQHRDVSESWCESRARLISTCASRNPISGAAEGTGELQLRIKSGAEAEAWCKIALTFFNEEEKSLRTGGTACTSSPLAGKQQSFGFGQHSCVCSGGSANAAHAGSRRKGVLGYFLIPLNRRIVKVGKDL